MKKAALLGLAVVLGATGFVACSLDTQGTLNRVVPSSSTSSTSQGNGGSGGSGGLGGAAGSVSTSSSTGMGGQGGTVTCELMSTPTNNTFDCNQQDECKAGVDCPSGLDCKVFCTGQASCKGATINCPPGFTCTIVCSGQDACQDTIINCPAGSVCHLTCGTAPQTCENTTLTCDGLDCDAQCSGSSKPNVACNNAPCRCASCP